jgi:hypothetical protein
MKQKTNPFSILFLACFILLVLSNCQSNTDITPIAPSITPISGTPESSSDSQTTNQISPTTAPLSFEIVEEYESFEDAQNSFDFPLIPFNQMPYQIPLYSINKVVDHQGRTTARLVYTMTDSASTELDPAYTPGIRLYRVDVFEYPANGELSQEELPKYSHYNEFSDIHIVNVRGSEGMTYRVRNEIGILVPAILFQENELMIEVVSYGNPLFKMEQSPPQSLASPLIDLANGLNIPESNPSTVKQSFQWESVELSIPNIDFKIPNDWELTAPDTYRGSDGFAKLESYSGPGRSIEQICEYQANTHWNINKEYVFINTLPLPSGISSCSIITENNNEEILYFINPNNCTGPDREFLQLTVDPANAPVIFADLDIALQNPTPYNYNIYSSKIRPEGTITNTIVFEDLIIDETKVISVDQDAPSHFEYQYLIPAAVLKKNNQLRDKPDYSTTTFLNPPLKDANDNSYSTQFVGNTRREFNPIFSIQKNDEILFTYQTANGFSAGPYLQLWEDRWILEINGMLIIDGELMNDDWEADEIFSWQLLNGRPFYFFSKNKQIFLNYDGQILPMNYDEVAHYQCCEASVFNVQRNQSMVWFHALRDGMWYYVEIASVE